MKFNEIRVKEDNLSSRKHVRHEKLDHEVHMAKSDLVALAQDSRDLLMLLQKYGSDERGIPGWIASKITKAQYINLTQNYCKGRIRLNHLC